mgnify:CR=1 FL=1
MKVGRPTGYVDPNRTNNTGLYGESQLARRPHEVVCAGLTYTLP